MIDRARAERLLAERRARRERDQHAEEAARAADELRAFFYGKQRAFFAPGPSKQRATTKTRRAGATTGGCREMLARAISGSRWRGVYITTTRKEARERAWESDTQGGLVDLLRLYGEQLDRPGVPVFKLGGVEVEVREAELELRFSNGSKIELFGADDLRALRKLRGLAKHLFWVDEAQDFRFMADFWKGVLSPALADFGGEVWLTGTPGRDCVGFFYDVTRGEVDLRLAGWDVHELRVVDNPFFGRVVLDGDGGGWCVVDNLGERTGPYDDERAAEEAAGRIRWERTAGAAIRANAWAEDDPDLLREWFARWVKTDARFVYAANAVPEHELCYAPQRLDVDGFPDVRLALDDLPGRAGGREYFLALGADLGTRAAFAFVLWAWSLRDPVLYEVCSWKRSGLDYDEMARHLHAIRAQAVIGMVVADAGGGGKPAVAGWSKKWIERYQLPIAEASKANKYIAIQQVNTDIRQRHVLLRYGSPLLLEWRSHLWAPVRSEAGTLVESATTRHDCSDAGLYAHRESYHHRYREPELTPQVGTPDWVSREEQRLEQLADDGRDELDGLSW